jgi:hypothetical protein
MVDICEACSSSALSATGRGRHSGRGEPTAESLLSSSAAAFVLPTKSCGKASIDEVRSVFLDELDYAREASMGTSFGACCRYVDSHVGSTEARSVLSRAV